jgi:hypoxanthine phosphoribosyltransferase
MLGKDGGGNLKNMTEKNKIKISWDKVEKMIDQLVTEIKKSGIKFDGIYGIPRAGLPIAVMMSHRLLLPVLLYPTKNTLVVDDISDEGFTLQRMKNKKIATLYSTDWTITKPDWFVGKKKSKNDWIVFPWEIKEEEARYSEV